MTVCGRASELVDELGIHALMNLPHVARLVSPMVLVPCLVTYVVTSVSVLWEGRGSGGNLVTEISIYLQHGAGLTRHTSSLHVTGGPRLGVPVLGTHFSSQQV